MIQELARRNEALQRRVSELEARQQNIAAMEDRIRELETLEQRMSDLQKVVTGLVKNQEKPDALASLTVSQDN